MSRLLSRNLKFVGAGLVPALAAGATIRSPLDARAKTRATTRVAPTIGEIVGAFKSITTHKYIHGVDEFAWPVFF
jgi:putative transposase